MPDRDPPTFDRLMNSRLVQAIVVFAGASWVVLQVVDMMIERIGLPEWIFPAILLLLGVGLLVVIATAWVQSRPSTTDAEIRGEVPGDWEVAPRQALGDLLQGQLPHLTWGRTVIGGVLVLVTVLAAGGLWTLVTGRPPILGPEPVRADAPPIGIAVLPFTTNAPELDLWREGLVDVLSTSLDGVAGYRTIDSRTILSLWDREVPEGSNPDLEGRLGVAESTGARYAIVGSAVALGPSVRLSADVYELVDGTRIAGGTAEGPADSVLAVVDRLASSTMRGLLAEVGGEGVTDERMASLTTGSLEAMRAYLEGESLYRNGSLAAAGEAFVRALRQDTTFALAAYRADQVFGWVFGGADAGWVTERLDALRNELPARDRAFATAMYQLGSGRFELDMSPESLVRSYPDDAEAWNTLGEIQIHLPGIAHADHAETLETYEETVRLGPDFFPYYIHPIELSISMGDSARAAELLERMERLSANEPRFAELALAHELYFGDLEEDRSAIEAGDIDESALSILGRTMGGISPLPPLLPRYRALIEAIPHPGDPLLIRSEAEAALATGRPSDAWRIWSTLPEDDPHRPIAALRIRTLTGSMTDEPAGAETVHGSDFCGIPNGYWLCERAVGIGLVEAGRSTEALAMADRIEAEIDSLQIVGTLASIRRAGADGIRGHAALGAGDVVQGRRLLGEAMKVRFARFAQWTLARHHEERGELARAVELYRSFDGSPTYSPFAHLALGRLHERLGQRDSAEHYFRSALAAWVDAEPGFPPRVQATEGMERMGR